MDGLSLAFLPKADTRRHYLLSIHLLLFKLVEDSGLVSVMQFQVSIMKLSGSLSVSLVACDLLNE